MHAAGERRGRPAKAEAASIHGTNWTSFEHLDQLRRLQGASLDALGLGPKVSHGDSALEQPGVQMKRYPARSDARTPLVLVPAPIKRSYIFDLAPEVSVVRRCAEAGARVFLIDWQPASPDFGLDEFANRLIVACIDAAGGEPPILIGHSLGGLLAAIFAALHPGRIRGLVMISAPFHFGPDAGPFNAAVRDMDLRQLPAAVPGSFISTRAAQVAPQTFVWERSFDFAQSACDAELLRNHLRVQRWTLDEFAMPRRLFSDIVQLLMREDRFVQGRLTVGDHAALPSRIEVPLLCVVDPWCRIVPRQAVQPFIDAAGTRDKAVIEYRREPGVCLQHVGPLVGKRAHAELWPEILRWIESRETVHRGMAAGRE